MEKATIIKLTLNEARELYKSNNETLIELALKAFPEKELKVHHFSEIITSLDAVKALEMNFDNVVNTILDIKKDSRASAAMYKLNIIRKALNLGQDLHLTKNPKDSYIHYPYNPFVTKSSTCYKSGINLGNIEIIGSIKIDEKEYLVLGGEADYSACSGLGYFSSIDGVGYAEATAGFLGCASKEIAQHLGKYFGMLITKAKYGDLDGFEIIKDKYGNA